MEKLSEITPEAERGGQVPAFSHLLLTPNVSTISATNLPNPPRRHLALHSQPTEDGRAAKRKERTVLGTKRARVFQSHVCLHIPCIKMYATCLPLSHLIPTSL